MFQMLKSNPWCQVCVGINWETEEAGMRACARIGAGLVSDAKGFFGLCAAASVVVFLRVLREKVNEDIRQRTEVLLLGLGPASPSVRSSPSSSSSDVSTPTHFYLFQAF